MKRVLVTGAAGFIGSHLCEYLLEKGYEVIGIDNFSTSSQGNLTTIIENKRFTFHKGDICEYDFLEKIAEGCSKIYHLAASVGVKLIMEKPVEAIEVNMVGERNVYKVALKNNAKVFFASSSEIYGKRDNGTIREEEDCILGNPSIIRWSYGCTKILGEYLGISYHREYGLPVVIGRFFNICGPRQSPHYGMVLPRFIQSALKEEPIIVYGTGEQTRSFTYVKDAVEIVHELMEYENTIGEIFNIGNPEPVKIMDLACKIKEMTGSNSEIKKVPYDEVYPPGFEDMLYRVPDVSKLVRYIGNKIKVRLDELLQITIRYWRNRLKCKNSFCEGGIST